MRAIPNTVKIWLVICASITALFFADVLMFLYSLILDEKTVMAFVRKESVNFVNAVYYVVLVLVFAFYFRPLKKRLASKDWVYEKKIGWLVVHYSIFASAVLGVLIVLSIFMSLSYLNEIPPESPLRRQFWQLNIVAGVWSLIYCYFVCEYLARKWLYPMVFRGPEILQIQYLLGQPIKSRFFQFFLFTAVIPLFLVAYKVHGVFLGETVRPVEVYFIVGVFLLLGMSLTLALSQSLVDPVRLLADSTHRVSQGNFDVRVPVFSKDEVGRLSADFNTMAVGLRERELFRDACGKYLSEKVAQKILSGEQKLGGERKSATFLIADIIGFTSMSETMPADRVVSLLNDLFSEAVRVIQEERGVCDKFIGDGLLATFGLLEEDAFPESRAVRAAVKLHDAVQRLNQRRLAQGQDSFRIGIGVHCGEVVAGNVGAPTRMQYTVVGDPVNVTSRIEHLTRELGVPILVSEATVLRAQTDFRFEAVGSHPIRGKAQTITLYRPLGSLPQQNAAG